MPKYGDRYEVDYPLIRDGIYRADCRQVMASVGLPIPPKSACFFCGASKLYEIQRLAVVDPAYCVLSLAMEVVYRTGRHFRGDNWYTVKAKHKDTGEKLDTGFEAADKAEARAKFRATVKDTKRPYKYTVSVARSVGGLDFGIPWLKAPMSLPAAYRDRLRDFMSRRGHALQIDNLSLPVLG